MEPEPQQINNGLGRLRVLGFPVAVRDYWVDLYPGDRSIEYSFANEKHPYEPLLGWVDREAIRGFIEREIDGRGFWIDYQDRLHTSVGDTLVHGEYWILKRRPTLLEVVEAAVGVLEAHRGE